MATRRQRKRIEVEVDGYRLTQEKMKPILTAEQVLVKCIREQRDVLKRCANPHEAARLRDILRLMYKQLRKERAKLAIHTANPG